MDIFYMLKEKIIKYWIFVALSILLNILIQDTVLYIFGETKKTILLSIFVSIIIVFIFKYIMDKKYVYKYNIKQRVDKKSLILYLFFSIATTLLFFLVEFIVIVSFADFKYKVEVGSTIGLLLGYTIKFKLDQKITFKEGTK